VGLLKNPTWFEDATPVSPPSQWQYTSHSVVVTAASPAAAIFTGDLAFPVGTPITLSAATMPGGFTAGTTYYTTPTTSLNPLAFGLSTTVGGAPIVATSAGATVVAKDQRYIFNYANIANFNKVALLVHADGTNGATSAPDSSSYNHSQTHVNAGPDLSTAVKLFGTASLRCGAVIGLSNGVIQYPAAGTEYNLTGDMTFEGAFYIPASQVSNSSPIVCMKTVANATVMTISTSQNGGGNNSRVAFSLVSNNLGTATATGSTLLPTDTWHRYALVLVAATGSATLYVDGIVHATASFGGVPVFTAVSRVELGGDNAASTYYQGYLDETRFTNTLALYTAPYTLAAAAFIDPGNAPISAQGNITYIGNALATGGLRGGLFGAARIGYQIVAQASDSITFQYDIGSGPVTVPLTNTTGATGTISISLDLATKFVWGFSAMGGTNAIVALYEVPGDTTYGNVAFNAAIPETNTFDTLVNLRNRLMLRLGFGAQVATPPPGMTPLLNEFLQSAQAGLYKRYPARFSRRMFRWTLQAGQRFLGMKNNDDDTVRNLRADLSRGVNWSGVQDTRNTWTPMFEGIDPELYTMATQYGRPVRYEIRECIEVFPAPDNAYEVWLEANLALNPLVSDSDQTTIDSEVVFLFALATAKLHYAQADAAQTQAIANTYLGELVAGTHLNKRYVPGAVPVAPAVQPTLKTFLA
jgi:hypothetical protein